MNIYFRASLGSLLGITMLLSGIAGVGAMELITSANGLTATTFTGDDIVPSKSPFVFAPLSDFAKAGVATSYKVVGVYPSEEVLYQLKYCESRIFDAYEKLPREHRSELTGLTFLWYSDSQRGLGGNGSIHLKCNDITDEVLTSVFIHEMGHIVDTGLYDGRSVAGVSAFNDSRTSVFKNDPSIDFYNISWKDTTHVNRNSTAFDFVTQYAMTSPFEDFAESYNFYLLHGSQFKYMAKSNPRLSRKYAFLRDKVFHGKEFVNNTFKLDPKRRTYDATVLPFSLEKFLNTV